MKEVLIALNQQPIAVYPIYIDITGSMTAGVLLSQVMYWDSKMKGNEFYKNDVEFMKETRLTQSEFKTAKKIIADLPFITIQRKGVPCRTWYSVNHTNLLVVLQQFSSSFTYELGSRLSTSQRGVNLRTIIGTENTQEITTENTTEEEVETSSTPFLSENEIEDIEQQIYASKATEKKTTPQVAPTPRPKAKRETTTEDLDLVFKVVQYLNEKTEQQFQPGGEKTKSLILSRHHGDKWSLDDFKTVIDHKKSEWFVKDNLRQYLRPSTLFAAGHAEEYLQAAKLWKKKPVATSPGVVPLYRQENYQNVDKSKFKF